MHPIKAKRISRLASNLQKLPELPKEVIARYPLLASIVQDADRMSQELQTLATSGLNPPHAKPNDAVLAAENASLAAVLAKVVKRLGDKAVLAGGLAVIHWVDIRKTMDLDFAVLSSNLDAIKKLFPDGKMLDLIYTTKVDGVDVDFLLPAEKTAWTEEAIKAAKLETVLGAKVRVLTPEYLILYKLWAGRDRDFSDVKALLTLPGVADKARALVQTYLPQDEDDFNQIALEAEYGLI